LLFAAAAREAGAQAAYFALGIVVRVEDLVEQLFAALGALDKVPPRLTTYDAWYGNVCNSLLASAVAQDKRLWIAVDDLGHDENGVTVLDDEIRNFCNKLGQLIGAPQFRERFRLMFIAYPEQAPTLWDDVAWKEDCLADSDIQLAEVEKFLEAWSRERNKKMAAPTLSKYSTELVAQINAPLAPGQAAQPRLRRLNDALATLTQQLEQS
jgi:hypothetical protein